MGARLLLHRRALGLSMGREDPSGPEEATFRANDQRAFTHWLNLLAPVMEGHRFIIAMTSSAWPTRPCTASPSS
jgi:hypothetical protein